ncbi:hypothetical protein Moror_4945 [Moniliophthora roreri MCA 2997]|uniref:MARVEL domain-containing protein n=1 Tax=Moniliophthora roreri (strain MCA 2997) TaxID=1381753 RepID=V2WHV2_MONRO|nr:hypothetical protein Moror_4945 [Moniliophthora roreri MCA 2997]
MDLASFRIILYSILALISVILLGLCAARIQYTTNLPPRDPLNNGVNFYDPVIIELLVTTLLTLGWSGFIIVLYFKDKPNSVIKTYRDELIALVILWLLWLGGSAAASDIWGDVALCQQFQACQLLSAVIGVCWVGFVVLTIIFVASAKLRSEYGGLNVPLARRSSNKEKLPNNNMMGVA